MLDSCILPHYFIVFHPGSAGNFIATIVKNLVNNSLNNVETNSTGSSHHTTVFEKINKTDYLACGTFFYENSKFNSFNEKLEFHKNRINEITITTTQINWTHDFTNIPLYKILFPKSKILVITQETIEEKLTSTILQVHKNFLDKDGVSPIDNAIKNTQEKRWATWALPAISKILGGNNELSETIIQDRHNHNYRDLIEYVAIYGRMKYYNLLQYINDPPYEKDFANTVLYPVYDDPSKKYVIGNDYDYYTTDCVKVPYRTIINNDSITFLKYIEDFIGEVNSQQKHYIVENFNRYHTAQNKNIFINPKQYLLDLRQRAFNLVAQLKQ
jgi:hypothetical protein